MARPALAQTQAVSGRVVAAGGEGLPGVNVITKGPAIGTATNAEGRYSLAVPANLAVVTLTFSFVGFRPQNVVVGEQTLLNVTLSEDTKELDEVVITAPAKPAHRPGVRLARPPGGGPGPRPAAGRDPPAGSRSGAAKKSTPAC